jgi:Winged helix-turn-helix DNA-binding
MPEQGTASQGRKGEWTFLSNYAHVLVCIDRDPNIRTRDIALAVGITERATQAIVSDLVAAGYLTRRREGRRNVYTVVRDAPFRHPIEANHAVGDLLNMLDQPSRSEGSKNKRE